MGGHPYPRSGYRYCFILILELVLNFNLSRSMNKRPCHEMCCLCGRLVARWEKSGIELKCKRCKRIVVVRVEGTQSGRLPRTDPAGDSEVM